MVREAQRQAVQQTLSAVLDGFVWGAAIAGAGCLVIGTFSPLGVLAAGIGGAFIEGVKQ